MKRMLLIGLLAQSLAIFGSAPQSEKSQAEGRVAVTQAPKSVWSVRNALVGAAVLCTAVGFAHYLHSNTASVDTQPACRWVGMPGGAICMENTDEVFTNPAAFVARAQKQRAHAENEWRKAYAAKELNLNPDSFELKPVGKVSIPIERYDEAMDLMASDLDPEELMAKLAELQDESFDNSK